MTTTSSPFDKSYVQWSTGKGKLEGIATDISKAIRDSWTVPVGCAPTYYDWIQVGVECQPADPDMRNKWGNRVKVVRTARRLAELNVCFPLPDKAADTLLTVLVENLDPASKGKMPRYRCAPDFLEPLETLKQNESTTNNT